MQPFGEVRVGLQRNERAALLGRIQGECLITSRSFRPPRNLNSLMRDLADCFKLVEMPLPFAYMAHIRKLLVLWLLAVPCVLMGEGVGWISLIYCLFLMFAMIGLERVSWQLEVNGGAAQGALRWSGKAQATGTVLSLCWGARVFWAARQGDSSSHSQNPFGLDPTDHKLEPRMTSAVLYCLMTCEVQDPAIWRAALTASDGPLRG